jgi:hypothetical protein
MDRLSAAVRSGRRGSNPRPIAWKAIALPAELLPHTAFSGKVSTPSNPSAGKTGDGNGRSGQEWIRTTEVERQRIYSPPHLAALEPAPVCRDRRRQAESRLPVEPVCLLALSQRRDSNPRPADYKSAALPAELLWQILGGIRHPAIRTAMQRPFPNFWECKGNGFLQTKKIGFRIISKGRMARGAVTPPSPRLFKSRRRSRSDALRPPASP